LRFHSFLFKVFELFLSVPVLAVFIPSSYIDNTKMGIIWYYAKQSTFFFLVADNGQYYINYQNSMFPIVSGENCFKEKNRRFDKRQKLGMKVFLNCNQSSVTNCV